MGYATPSGLPHRVPPNRGHLPEALPRRRGVVRRGATEMVSDARKTTNVSGMASSQRPLYGFGRCHGQR